ncbi:hypothetical protein L1987_45876 [Smallanthus sonchifolius]|uniref:Uncharacterized protein n=1 Tax=Smallanthus sonchifolius TaxID=185202 RepID=A0ACB9FYT8_9ASTR|nr:hypothetical protein L1987_45876 [Smallanthus sonchifolius]
MKRVCRSKVVATGVVELADADGRGVVGVACDRDGRQEENGRPEGFGADGRGGRRRKRLITKERGRVAVLGGHHGRVNDGFHGGSGGRVRQRLAVEDDVVLPD